jgi:hypothetical protein
MIKVPSLIQANNLESNSNAWVGANGVDVNMSYVAEPKFGNVAEFNGTSSYVIIDNLIPKGNFTLSLWAKLHTIGSINYFAGVQISGNSGGRLMRTDTFAVVNDAGNIIQTTYDLTPYLNIWTFFAWVLDVENMEMITYVNGKILTQGNITGTFQKQTNNFTIGKRPDRAEYYLHGYLRWLNMYDRALIQSDIKRIMLGLKPISV